MTKDTSIAQAPIVTHNREDPMTAPQWAPNNQQSIVVPAFATASDAVNGIRDMPGHIFNHKGGLRVADGVQQSQQQQTNAIVPQHQQLPYQYASAYGSASEQEIPFYDPNYGPNVLRPMPQFPNNPVKSNQSPYERQQSIISHSTVDVRPQVNQNYQWPPKLPVQAIHTNEEVWPKLDGDTFQDVPVHDRKKDGKINVAASQPEQTNDEKNSDYDEDEEVEKVTEPPKKKNRKHRKGTKMPQKSEAEVGATQQMKHVHAKLQAEFLDHDGSADRPGGAVLSLTLGERCSNDLKFSELIWQ